jgi:hypothetical protein
MGRACQSACLISYTTQNIAMKFGIKNLSTLQLIGRV